MAFDHGTLNVPLAKRGDIDNQLDAYKAQVAATRKAEERKLAAELKTLRTEAKALVENTPADRLATLASESGLTITQARKKLRSMAHWSPAFVIRALGKL